MKKSRQPAPPPSSGSRRWILVVIGLVALYLGYTRVVADTPAEGGDVGARPTDRGARPRSVGPDLAEALGKVRAHRTGQIDWDSADAEGGVMVSGKIIEMGSPTPVGGVEVVFRSPAGEESTTANADGTYTIRMPPGIYRAFVRDDEFLSVGSRDRDATRVPGEPSADTAGVPDEALMSVVMANRDVAGMNLLVVHGGTISGKVVDQAGKPIANAVVSTTSMFRTALGNDIAETDEAGAFELRVAPGSMALTAAHPRFAGVSTDDDTHYLSIGPGTKATVTLTLVAGCLISGRVIGPDGKPTGDGALETQGPGGQSFGPTGRIEPDGSFRWVTQLESDTDAEGRWAVYAMPHGRYTLTAQSPERGVVAVAVQSPELGIRVVLGGTGRIEGTTTTLVDGSFTAAFVSCTMPSTTNGDAFVETSHQTRLVAVRAGHFEIENVPACNLTFIATFQNQRRSVEIDVPMNGIARTEVDIGPPRAKTVHGRVTRAGQPVGNARIVTYVDRDEVTATTDNDGRYTLHTFSRASIAVYEGEDYRTGGRVGGANVDQEEMDFELTDGHRDDGDENDEGGGDVPDMPDMSDDPIITQ
ncbi:MAG: carboxypeptidase-like regulatory domain-containing protein [Proteobacteria bacterium]|nr:carboxypeptidase-like regulatory domain-containing protein [Pseudomonadota bacterium]